MDSATQVHSTRTDVPLCVDLDGTLIRTDVLVEGYIRCVKRNVWYAVLSLFWLLRGIANLKAQVARNAVLDVALFPVNADFHAWLLEQHGNGRRLILCTAANEAIAGLVARRFGIFESTIASDSTTNLSGARKAHLLEKLFGPSGFDYAGNEAKDIEVWRRARHAIVVSPTARLRRRIADVPRVQKIFPNPNQRSISAWIRALRLHQWIKNLLIFVPALAAHKASDPAVISSAVLAFVWFGLCASATYVINDLLDLEADRAHAHKRLRPFASGEIPIVNGAAGALMLLTAGIAGSILTINGLFVLVLLTYVIWTLWYSLMLKRIAMVDVLSLAGLYTVRVIAGGAAVLIVPSFWLLAFSMFLFLSLAMAKRYTELRAALSSGKLEAAGRGYLTDDLSLLLSFGASSGLMSVLVLALYMNGGTGQLYRHPEALWMLCPMLLYWICRIWRKAYRGELHHDPVVFAVQDRPSLAVGCVCVALVWAAI
jgi:4-hydroxybenzoate polyprenyltransferase/phosphoserine phosphatase